MRRTTRTTAALSAAAVTLCTAGGITSATALANLRDAPSTQKSSVVTNSVAEPSTPQDQGRGQTTRTATAPIAKGTAVSIPAVGLDAGLSPIRFQGSVFNPPADINRGGIWGAKLGATKPSTTVLIGHVSDPHDRPGAFKRIWDAQRGMTGTTRDAKGRIRTWKVAKIWQTPKESLPRSVFLPGKKRVLRLITCYDRITYSSGRFHYRSNLVVEMTPVD